MYQVVKGASPKVQIHNTRSLVNGLYARTQLQIIMHFEKDCLGIKYSNDKNA